MRRSLGIILLVVAMLTGSLPFPAAAQSTQQLNVFPGNIVSRNTTATTIGNTATATNIFSYNIPARFLEQFRQPFVGAGALHVKLLGVVSTNPGSGTGVGNLNVGCSYGGSTASIALVNALNLPPTLSSAPFQIDLWLRTQGSTPSPVLFGRAEFQTLAASVTSVNMASVVGTTSTASANNLNCIWAWASASASNTATINHSLLVIGE